MTEACERIQATACAERSGGGFITDLLLPQGNAADFKQLVPMLDRGCAAYRVSCPTS